MPGRYILPILGVIAVQLRKCIRKWRGDNAHHRLMKKPPKLFLIPFIIYTFLLLTACMHVERYKASGKIYNCKGLYSNVYNVYWWGFYKDPNAWAIYITDSTNFRINLGIYGDYDSYGCKIKNDTLYIEKETIDRFVSPTVVERRKYSLKSLKREHTYER